MICLSNGHSFQFAWASGTYGFDGRGWSWDKPLINLGLMRPELGTNFLKTVDLGGRKGNQRWYDFTGRGCVRFLRNGTVNAVGLSNPGIAWFCNVVLSNLDPYGPPVVPSVHGKSEQVEKMARMIQDVVDYYGLKCVVALELNASCPNVGENLLENIAVTAKSAQIICRVCRLPLVVKVSAVHDQVVGALIRQLDPWVEAYSINSAPWRLVFPSKVSPLAHLGGGGVSGRAAQKVNWSFLDRLARLSSRPVIGPDPWRYDDIDRLFALGAKAVACGAIHIPDPLKPWTWVRPILPTLWIKRWLRQQECEKIIDNIEIGATS